MRRHKFEYLPEPKKTTVCIRCEKTISYDWGRKHEGLCEDCNDLKERKHLVIVLHPVNNHIKALTEGI